MAGNLIPSGIDQRRPLPPLFFGDDFIEISTVSPLDLLSIFQHRDLILWFNTELFLLHNSHNLFARVGIETLVGGGSWFTQSIRSGTFHPSAFGQVEYCNQCARLNWLLNCNASDESPLIHLIDNLSFEAGLHGAKFLCAGVEKDSDLFPYFRRAGYCVYGWERFWQLNPPESRVANQPPQLWGKPFIEDSGEIAKFRNKHLPPAVRSISTFEDQNLPDYVLRTDHVISAYAEVRIFGNKAVIHPVLDENLPDPQSALLSLAAMVPEIVTVVYIAQTTNHNWLEDALCRISYPVTSRKELMVKYFSVMEKAPIGILNHSSESSHPDPVAPYVHSSKL